jgi:RND family efflux transporter MFP subunit
MLTMSKRALATTFMFVPLLLIACGQDRVSQPKPARPVTYISLKKMNPSATTRLAGTAEAWKREELAFEVPGRVARIVEPGINIEGRTFDENGKPLNKGTVLAELDDERYRIALKQAQDAAEVTRKQLEHVIPQQIQQALASFDLAKKEVDRYQRLVAKDVVAQEKLDVLLAAQKTAAAEVAKVKALRAAKDSELNAARAQIDQAQRNIRDSTLHSPFSGQVARVNVIPGGYAFRGIPVMTIQMMDPIKVNIAVSPKTDARINVSDLLRVYTPSGEELIGYVYLKDTSADPSTRTFLVELLVQNRRDETGVPADLKSEPIPRCRYLWYLVRPERKTFGNYYVEVDAIQKDEQGYFVWKAENLTVDQLRTDFSPVLTVRKVRVTPGDGRLPLLQVFTFRELEDLGKLDPKKDVIVGHLSGKLEDGGRVILARERWALRPGDVVRVQLRGEETPTGFYVPSDAIQFDGNQNYVMVAMKSGESHEAARVNVTLGRSVGRIRQIISKDDSLKGGTNVIVDGAHYLNQGDRVNPVDKLEVTP